MANKKKTARRSAPGKKLPPESRSAEATTVFWMLTMMATLGAELASLAAWLLIAATEDKENIPLHFIVLPGLLLLISAITGVLCLALVPVVYRVRRTAPPVGISVIAVAAGASPLVVLIVMQLIAAV